MRQQGNTSFLANGSRYMLPHRSPKSWKKVPRLQVDGLSQLWKGGEAGDVLPEDESGAVKLVCQVCGKLKLRSLCARNVTM
jgi:hypothetical protein